MGRKLGGLLVVPVVLLVAATASTIWTAGPAFANGRGGHHRPPPYGPHTCTVVVTVSPASVGHGGTITVSLSGDCFRDTFAIVVHTKERTLGAITTDATGNGSGTFALPCAVNVGSHTVTAADAFGNSGSAGLRVTPSPCASAPGHRKGHRPPHEGGGPPHQRGHHGRRSHSDVRIAGVNAQAGIPVGAAAVGVASLAILKVRKRRRGNWG